MINMKEALLSQFFQSAMKDKNRKQLRVQVEVHEYDKKVVERVRRLTGESIQFLTCASNGSLYFHYPNAFLAR